MKYLDDIDHWDLFESEMEELNNILMAEGDERTSINDKRANLPVPKVMFVGSDEQVLENVGSRVKAEYMFVDVFTHIYAETSRDKLIAEVDEVKPVLLWIDLPKSQQKEVQRHLNVLGKYGQVHIVNGFFAQYVGMRNKV